MSQDGFIFDELANFRKSLIHEIKNDYPKELKKYIKQQGRNLSKVAKKIAKSEVGTSKGKKKDWIDTKSYHKRFDSSSVFETWRDEICCKAFNNARHAKLIENGHVNVPRGKKGQSNKGGSGTTFTAGKFIFKKAEMQYTNTFSSETEKFLSQYFDKTIEDITK